MAEQGRLKMALEKFIQQTLPGVDYLAQYEGTIVSQKDQTFDFQPDSDKVPGISGLSFYTGPGVTLTLDTDQKPRAVLFFAGGSPQSPRLGFAGMPGLKVYSLQAETEIEILAPTVKIGNNASAAAARVGDGVTIALADLQQFVFTAPSMGGPCTITGAIVGPPATQISSGSSEVSIG